jgi:Rps23 Pro-64 3,4-dihydroxylase Tpa1-like proline 4-hydroxylase
MSELLYFLDRNQLVELAERSHAAYLAAEPFPSFVFDDFLPAEVAERIARGFPKSDFAGFKQPDNTFQQKKLGRTQESYFEGVDSFVRHMLNEFNSLAFIDFLENLTGIHGLIPDPHFKGGALHQILRGGKLAIHADFNRDRYRELHRRVNALLFFNPDWNPEYRGELELWDRKMTKCVKKISPILNRCVVFNTMADTFHGHPDPLQCPEGVTRNSIALYYYTASRDDGVNGVHSTIWRSRPDLNEPEGEGDQVKGEVRREAP